MTMNRAACYLGLDLGATNAKAALVDDDGRVVRYASLALGPGAARLAPERVAAALASCAATAVAGDWRAVAGCGVGSPGLVAGGAVAGAANLFRGEAAPVPLRALVAAELRRAAGRRVACDLVNDADAAARAEAWVGAARGARRAALLTLGSGVGCGVVVDGVVLAGCMEGGHMIVGGLRGRRCPCGSRGCLEAYASANAVAAAYADARAAGAEGARGARASCAEVFARAAAGDAAAAAVVDDAAAHVALGCLNLARVLDCDVVVLAGGVAAAGSALLDPVRAHVRGGAGAGCFGVAPTRAAVARSPGGRRRRARRGVARPRPSRAARDAPEPGASDVGRRPPPRRPGPRARLDRAPAARRPRGGRGCGRAPAPKIH